MDEASEGAPRERGWGRPLIALGAFAFLPWLIPWARIAMPIERGTVLLAPAIAACALVAWRRGGRAGLAILWLAISLFMMVSALLGTRATGFDRLAMGWATLLAASFGLSCLAMPRASFLPRAIASVALAAAVGLGLSAAGTTGVPEPFGRSLRAEWSERTSTSVSAVQAFIDSSPTMAGLKEESRELSRLPVLLESSLVAAADKAAIVYPALLALEGLAALALAWALFHRLSRTRIGAPLARLKDFRFNDQLVWGLLAGAAIVAVPAWEAWRAPGWNLLLFFGGLYALRGLAVLMWYLGPVNQVLQVLLIGVVLAVPKYGLALTFGVGLGDTWLNLRARPKPAT